MQGCEMLDQAVLVGGDVTAWFARGLWVVHLFFSLVALTIERIEHSAYLLAFVILRVED